MLSVIILRVVVLRVIMLRVIMLSVIVLSVIMPSVVMLSLAAPEKFLHENFKLNYLKTFLWGMKCVRTRNR